MKAKIINIKDLPTAAVKTGRPRAKLPQRELLLGMREQGLTLREMSSRTGIPLSTLGNTLRGKLTPKLMKARRRRARKKRRTRIEI
ncbi:hypothetical protein ES703_68680 [subsurface metagenome]